MTIVDPGGTKNTVPGLSVPPLWAVWSFRANLALQASANVPANLQSFCKLIRFLAQLALQPSAKYEPKLF